MGPVVSEDQVEVVEGVAVEVALVLQVDVVMAVVAFHLGEGDNLGGQIVDKTTC